MNREAQFVAALQSAAGLRIDGDTLQISNAGGQIAMIATRVP